MGIQTQITVTCDNKDCTTRLSWDKSAAESGQTPPPEEAQYLVIFNQNGTTKSFCGQLCAAKYFLPPGYEITQKKLIPFPQKTGWIETRDLEYPEETSI